MIVAERLTYVAPLGIAFLDPANGRRVEDGLIVSANGVRAFANRVGVFVLAGIPGLGATERGEGDEDFWADPPTRAAVTVQVDDRYGRFLPFSFEAGLPARGLFELACGSPPGAPAPIVLFSAPARSVPAGSAVVRADLWDVDADAPAAWALLEARAPGLAPARGLADVRGSVAVVFPYPEPPGLDGSPPSPQRKALARQSWTIQLRAFAAPQPEVVPNRPDLCAALMQPAATLLADTSPASPLTDATLEYGRELVVSTGSESVLILTPAA